MALLNPPRSYFLFTLRLFLGRPYLEGCQLLCRHVWTLPSGLY